MEEDLDPRKTAEEGVPDAAAWILLDNEENISTEKESEREEEIVAFKEKQLPMDRIRTKFNIRQYLLSIGFKLDDIQRAFIEYENRYDYSYSDSVEWIVQFIAEGKPPATKLSKPTPIKCKSKKQKKKGKKECNIIKIKSKTQTKNQKRKIKIKLRKTKKKREFQTVIVDTPHGSNLTVKYLTNIKLWDKYKCLIFGLQFEEKQILFINNLASKEWFGKFGNILNIFMLKNSNCVEIEFENEYSTLNAISYCNKDSSTRLRARYQITKYCKIFLMHANQQKKIKKCFNKCCRDIHSWQTPNDVVSEKQFSKINTKDLHTFKLKTTMYHNNECKNVVENDVKQSEQLQVKCQQQRQEIMHLKTELCKYLQEIEHYKQKCDMLQTEISKNINNLCEEKFKCWLCEVVGLKEYLSIFVNNEYNDITMIEYIDQDVIVNELGITNKRHIQLLVTHVEEFKHMRQKFNALMTRNKILKQFEQNLIENGILTINDLKKDINTKADTKRILKINNQNEIQHILSIIKLIELSSNVNDNKSVLS